MQCIRWGQNRTNSFAAAKGDKIAMRPFAKLLWAVMKMYRIVTLPRICCREHFQRWSRVKSIL